jgi:hypothetical protein
MTVRGLIQQSYALAAVHIKAGSSVETVESFTIELASRFYWQTLNQNFAAGLQWDRNRPSHNGLQDCSWGGGGDNNAP